MNAKKGKYAEGKVRDFLKTWAEAHASFAFNRILDAHSAKGAMSNPQPGDFQWFLDCQTIADVAVAGDRVERPYTRNGLIEVKEVAHSARLPHKNFSADQIGRLNIRRLAGSEPLVLVCHKMEGVGKSFWRAPPLSFFEVRTGGSWDLREFPTHPLPSGFLEEYLS